MASSNPIRLPYFTGGLLLLFAVLAVYSLNSGTSIEGERSEERVAATLREAANAYHVDHGFYPGSRGDFGYPLSDEQLREKLLQYSDATGQTSSVESHRFRYGPYLREFPADPRYGSRELSWALGSEAEVAAADQGGWIYAPELGVFVARSEGLSLHSEVAGF